MARKERFDDFFDRILELVRDRRQELGWTQAQLAEKIRKPQSVIGRFESGGVRDPRLSMLFSVCQAMELDPSEVLTKAGVKGKVSMEAKNLAGARRATGQRSAGGAPGPGARVEGRDRGARGVHPLHRQGRSALTGQLRHRAARATPASDQGAPRRPVGRPG